MFFPQAMTEFELIVPEKDLLAVTRVLSGQGIVHQVDVSHMGVHTKGEHVETWKDRAATYAGLERQVQLMMQALSIEESAPGEGETDGIAELDSVRPVVERIDAKLKEANATLVAQQKELERLENNIRRLEPVADLDLDLGGLTKPGYIHSILGIVPTANLDRLQTSLSRIPYVLVPLQEDRKNTVIWLTGAKANEDILDRAARSAYVDPLDLASMPEGSPTEIIADLRGQIEATNASIENQQAVLAELRAHHEAELKSLLWRIRTSRLLADAMGRYGKLRYTYLIVGWVPTRNIDSITNRLKQASNNIIIDTTSSERHGTSTQNIPVSLRNPGFLGAFEGLVTTYARPRYEEIDPTFLTTITFPLLFGLMFGDVFHGLLLALFGWLLANKKVRALRSMAGLGPVIVACGLVATVCGFFYGSIFGKEEILPEVPFLRSLIVLQPLHNPIQILGFAVGIGVVIISIGLLLNLYNAVRARDWGRLLFDHHGLVGLVLYWSLLGFAVAAFVKGFPVPTWVFLVLAAVAAVGIMFSETFKHLIEGHRPLVEGGIAIYLLQAGVELFEVLISFFSNTLSYARVGGFALAHVGLSLAVYIMAGLFAKAGIAGVILFWIVAILGNIFIVAFEGLIVGIQTMRLHYYEFFSKFFTGGGAPYEPLAPLPLQE